VIAIANQKRQASGKTTTAINLGTALAAIGETRADSRLDPKATPRPAWARAQESRTSTYDVAVGSAQIARGHRAELVPQLSGAVDQDLVRLELEIADRPRDRAFRCAPRSTTSTPERREFPFQYV